MRLLCVLFVLMPMSLQTGDFIEAENTSPCTDTNHLFLAPGVLTAGGTNRACVSRFYTEGPARMALALVADEVQAATASRELPPGDGGCIDITVPQKPNTKAKLVVKMWYPEAVCSWERELSVLISGGRVVVVQVERARYRPGETLRVRVLALKPDLTPAHGQIDEVWLEGPQGAWEGSRAAQWLRVRTRMGIAQVQHELDELAPAGRWTIRAKLADGSMGSAGFWVGNYELPPFQLSVRHAPRVLRTSERLVWTVCVRYPWTEAVEGMLVIRIRGAGGPRAVPGAEARGIRTVARIRAPRACHRHAAAARRVGLDDDNPPDVVVADFSFQEEGTRIWQNTTVVSQVVDKPVTLEFLRKRAVISPGLPYKLKVKATRWDDKPAASELVRICRSSHGLTSNDTCLDALTDERGIARVTFTASDDAATYYSFQASLRNDSSISALPLHLPARLGGTMHASLGPIKPDAGSARTFVPLYINLTNVSKPLTVHFVVITRGGIIYRWGATTQCPLTSSSDYIPTTSRNTQCQYKDLPSENLQFKPTFYQAKIVSNPVKETYNQTSFEDVGYQNQTKANLEIVKGNLEAVQETTTVKEISPEDYLENPDLKQDNPANNQEDTFNSTVMERSNAVDSDSLLNRHLLRVMLPIKVSHQMCPDSHLIAYFYYKGELVSASKQFEMEECFSNKVETTWLTRQVAPGSLASLRVTTPGPALCALSVLDSASKWNQPAPTVKELVMTGLKRLMDSHRNLTEYEAAGACFKTSDELEQPTSSLEQTATWLAAAGVRVTGGDMADSTRCISPPASMVEDAPVPRSDFSEAWLWRLAAVGSNGSSVVSARAPDSISRFEASTVCLARTGISVSPPVVLQVFREFFIHADAPRRLRRGDSAVVRYRLFNYLYEPLSVQIQIVTDSLLEGAADTAESVCVGARTSVGRRAELRARNAGRARLVLRAGPARAPACAPPTTRPTPVSDEVIIPITIEPEGVPVQEHKSTLLCGRGSPESSLTDVSWSWPPIQPVPGTETLTVWAMGDVKGPLLFDADGLVTLPRGCGEQNLARLAANLLALEHLPSDSAAAAVAKEHVARGFARQLQYAHARGGFSAFGARDAAPSTWLTAFALKYLPRAHKILNPELPIPPVLENAERWLLSQQMENGCFRNEGQVFHRELRGGLNEEGEIASVALTAYVITALLDSNNPVPARVLRAATACLRALPPAKTSTSGRVYAHALLGYAFMRLRSYEEDLKKINEASLMWDKKEVTGAGLKDDEELRELAELLKIAKRSGDYVWWETANLATSVEATGYALLALSRCPACAADARAATRWLSAHRTHAGGFLSTQDTLVALEAISRWSSVQPSAPPNLTVNLKSGNDVKKILIQPDTKVPEVTRITGKSQVDVSVEGTGCALIQATRSYNSLASDLPQGKQLTVQANVLTDGPFDCDLNRTSCFCAAVVEVCVSWTGEFPTMAVVEAALPSGYGVDASRLYDQLDQSDTLIRRIEVPPSGGRATLYLSAGAGGGAGGRGAGHACARLHAVGPRARTRPAHVRVMDYYAPANTDTQMYTIPEDCPPRISHTINEYQSSDNLFNKAKSLTDSGEILITHEFSFEDIPEGIPLDDPLYELGRDEIAYFTKPNAIKKAKDTLINEQSKSANTINYTNNVDIKEKPIERVEDKSNVKKKLLAVSNNMINTPNNENKRNNVKASRARKGHSIPFVTNYPGRNFNDAFGVNDHYDGYHRQFVDPSYLYPEPVFYNINPYARRIDEYNSGFKYYQETKARPYDAFNIGQHKHAFMRENDWINQKLYSTPNSRTFVENHTGLNVHPNIHHNVPLTYESPPVGPVIEQNEKLNPKEFIANNIPELKEATTPIYLPSKPIGYEFFGHTDRPLMVNQNPSSPANTNSSKFSNAQTVDTISQNPVNSKPYAIKSHDPYHKHPEENHSYISSQSTINTESSQFQSLSTDSEKVGSSNLYSTNHNPSLSNYNPGLIMTDDQLNKGSADLSDKPDAYSSTNTESIKDSLRIITQSNNPNSSIISNVAGPDSAVSTDTVTSSVLPSFDPNSSNFVPTPSNLNALPVNYNPSTPNFDLIPPNHKPDLSSAINKNPTNNVPDPPNVHSPTNKESQKVPSQVDNPNLSGFHVIESESDLAVPTGVEGPVPALALPPQGFVPDAQLPGFQPAFLHGGYPRLYPLPPRPQFPYRYVPAG